MKLFRKIQISYAFLLLAFSIILFACKKDKPIPAVDLGYDYFPIEIGHWIEYEVDSIVYNDFTGTIDSSHYYIKELLESEFIDNENRPTIRIERYYKPHDTLDYMLKDVWYVNRTSTTAEKVEENKRIIKLAFPVRNKNVWDANAFNFDEELIMEYDKIHEAYSLNSFSFDSSVTVQHYETTTLISEAYQYEVFAKNIGMIKKKYLDIEKVWDVFSQSWIIDSGVILEYTMIDYKK
jgi:hypothetical protein